MLIMVISIGNIVSSSVSCLLKMLFLKCVYR